MDGILAPLLVLASFAVVLVGLARMAARARRRGGGDSVMGPFDEIWNPAAHRARMEVRAQEERPAPSPLPGDRLV